MEKLKSACLVLVLAGLMVTLMAAMSGNQPAEKDSKQQEALAAALQSLAESNMRQAAAWEKFMEGKLDAQTISGSLDVILKNYWEVRATPSPGGDIPFEIKSK